jgi:hypothetical protein
MLFHLVYGDNKDVMMEFMFASAQRLYSLSENVSLHATFCRMMQHPEVVSLQQCRGMFFLLLNVDMPLKEYVCDTQNKSLLAVALNLADASEVTGKHAYAMIGARQPDAPKLESFFLKLGQEIVPQWLQNETLGPNDLANTVRDEYIIS